MLMVPAVAFLARDSESRGCSPYQKTLLAAL